MKKIVHSIKNEEILDNLTNDNLDYLIIVGKSDSRSISILTRTSLARPYTYDFTCFSNTVFMAQPNNAETPKEAIEFFMTHGKVYILNNLKELAKFIEENA